MFVAQILKGNLQMASRLATDERSRYDGADWPSGLPYDDTRVFDVSGQGGRLFQSRDGSVTLESLAAAVTSGRCATRVADAFSAIGIWSAAFYHFHLDTLPKLLIAAQLRKTLVPGLAVVVEDQMLEQQYTLPFLTELGFSGGSLISGAANNSTDLCAHNLWIPVQPWAAGGYRSLELMSTLRSLGSRVAARAPLPMPAPTPLEGHIVVCSRNDTSERRWTNEREVLAALAAGLPSVQMVRYPPTYSTMAEVLSLFSGAKVVFGPHGAGLTMLMFAAPDAITLEAAPNNPVPQNKEWKTDYYKLTRSLARTYLKIDGGFDISDSTVELNPQSTLAAMQQALHAWQNQKLAQPSSR